MNEFEIKVDSSEEVRIDKYLTSYFKDYSRSFIKNLFSDNSILLNNKIAKPSTKVVFGDIILVSIPEKKDISIKPENIFLDVVYEDEYLAIINKPVNMIVHPTESITEGTLVNAIMYRFEKLSDLDLPFRPGIVHRLDKDTTGLIIIAKDNNIHLLLQKMFKDRRVKKTYLAIVHGRIQDSLVLNFPIGRHIKDRKKMSVRKDIGKEAVTRIFPILSNENYSLLKINIDTGRTHQIRVHLKYIHHCIVGDKIYGQKNEKVNFNSQLLHAYKLEFNHPVTGDKLTVSAEPDDTFKSAVKKLF
ncbi:RluA family pseudouridine synthase [Miniphocaeibacter halophilus]|uniref:RluA family pseudouridine synthase n=1 Tax=Miniphocaeibacter halophilus TaxID=2931922 RepID=A0AC61MQ47_9FIRM|nr:RluA family pseudouridine synthase [Miniphocaeibacter halophilus]QQK07689.1 RluA family pseudouridine synthase [Miniphocaeibacter halophilus]